MEIKKIELELFKENEDTLSDNEIEIDNDYNETDESNFEADKFRQILQTASDWTVETILSQIRRKNIILSPVFQRRNVWNNKMKSTFIESILLNIPIPNILLGEDPKFKNKYLVIDGKQRLITLSEFYGIPIDEKPSRKPFKKLTGLKILKHLNGYTVKDFQKQNMEEINIIDNTTIRTSMIRNIPEDTYLYEIFARINTGSEKLSPQELRQSRFPGDFIDYLSTNSATQEINDLLKLNGLLHARMKDTELLLRAYAFKFKLPNYDNSISKFLDLTVKDFNDRWDTMMPRIVSFYDEVKAAIKFVHKHFNVESFSLIGLGREKVAFNRPIFDLMMYFFTNNHSRVLVDQSGISLREVLFDLIKHNDVFAFSITTNTHQTLHTKVRFKIFYDTLVSIYNVEKDNYIASIDESEIARLKLIMIESE